MQNIELRDWFAGQAFTHLSNLGPDAPAEAYRFADAMLAARGPAKPPAPDSTALTLDEYDIIWRALMVEAAEIERRPDANTARAPVYRTLAERFKRAAW